MALSVSQNEIQITDNWELLLKKVGSQNAFYVGDVSIEGLTREIYPAYRACNNPDSPLVAYIR